MLKSFHTRNLIEVGCDEAGRGCLAGPVFAAAVILPPSYKNPLLNDSKLLDHKKRELLRQEIMEKAENWAVASVTNEEIDEINILNASILAMHKALDQLSLVPQHILVDGNRFKPYKQIRHQCIIKGDGLYNSIAAASILAKTFRDDFMQSIHNEFPQYGWQSNKGYATRTHVDAISRWGYCRYHRKSFKLKNQLSLKF